MEQIRRQHFDGHTAVHIGVAGKINGRHAPLPHQMADDVTADGCPSGERRLRLGHHRTQNVFLGHCRPSEVHIKRHVYRACPHGWGWRRFGRQIFHKFGQLAEIPAASGRLANVLGEPSGRGITLHRVFGQHPIEQILVFTGQLGRKIGQLGQGVVEMCLGQLES